MLQTVADSQWCRLNSAIALCNTGKSRTAGALNTHKTYINGSPTIKYQQRCGPE